MFEIGDKVKAVFVSGNGGHQYTKETPLIGVVDSIGTDRNANEACPYHVTGAIGCWSEDELELLIGIGQQKIKVKASYDFGSTVAINGKKRERIVATKKAKTYKYATVRFLSSRDETSAQKQYSYLNTAGASKYDSVIVDTRFGMSLAVVTSVSDVPPKEKPYTGYGYSRDAQITPLKEVLEIVTSKEVSKLMQTEKKKDIKKKLEAEVKKMDEVERFNIYAANNPAFAELLEEYKNL